MDTVSWRHAEVLKKTTRVSLGASSQSYVLEELGWDRLCFLEAILAQNYHHRHSKDGWTMAVSFGTAITVDFISFGGEYFGGYILPSVFLSVSALNQWTDGISDVRVLGEAPVFTPEGCVKDFIGHCTETAVGYGTFAEKIGGIGYLFRNFAMALTQERLLSLLWLDLCHGW